MGRSLGGHWLCWLAVLHSASVLGCPGTHVKYQPRFITTDTGSPVFDLNASLTVGPEGGIRHRLHPHPDHHWMLYSTYVPL